MVLLFHFYHNLTSLYISSLFRNDFYIIMYKLLINSYYSRHIQKLLCGCYKSKLIVYYSVEPGELAAWVITMLVDALSTNSAGHFSHKCVKCGRLTHQKQIL